jgi:hypothetical protein
MYRQDRLEIGSLQWYLRTLALNGALQTPDWEAPRMFAGGHLRRTGVQQISRSDLAAYKLASWS